MKIKDLYFTPIIKGVFVSTKEIVPNFLKLTYFRKEVIRKFHMVK